MKPSRTKKAKRFRFHPIKKREQEESSDEEETEQFLYRNKLGGITPAVREEVTAYLANVCSVPAELREPDTLRLLVERLGKEEPAVTYNAIFAIKNLIELDRQFLGQIIQLNLLNYLTGILQEMATSSSKDIAKKIVEAVYVLLLTLAESVNFDQLSHFDQSDQFRGYVEYLLAVLRETTILDNSEPAMEFLKVVAEYTVRLRALIAVEESKSHVIERVFNKTEGRLQCVACYVLLFVGGKLQPSTVDEMINLFNDQVNNNNLEQEYRKNIGDSETPQQNEDLEEEIEKEEPEIEIEKPDTNAAALQNKERIFAESIQMANTMTQWLLSIIEKDEEEEQDSEDEVEAGSESIAIPDNQELKAVLKSRLTSIEGVIRNTQLRCPGSVELVDMSWRVVQISIQYLNQEKILTNAFATLSCILSESVLDEISQSIVETCLAIVLEIWEKHFSNSKLPIPSNFDHLIPAANKILTSASTDKSKMIMLELLGNRYNPEKRPVSLAENQQLGLLLKTVMITCDPSNLTLQCQCLDTLFDIYCNEDFDNVFKELGLMSFLEAAFTAMKSLNKKSKFFRQVAQDLKRFIDYKREQLSKQGLL